MSVNKIILFSNSGILQALSIELRTSNLICGQVETDCPEVTERLRQSLSATFLIQHRKLQCRFCAHFRGCVIMMSR